jgi:hypothetical protein
MANETPESLPESLSAAGRAALGYAELGWSVLPLRAKSKRPLVAWRPLEDRRAGRAELEGWFRRWPDANVGIVTGAISRLVVLDIDPQHGGDHGLAAIERRHGPLRPTVEVATGGGGRHFYFAAPGGEIRNRAGLAQGVDLRGDGGYIVAPPSIHPSGRPYRWVAGRGPHEFPLAPMPPWIPRLSGGARAGRSVEDWRKLVREGVPEGTRNATIASLTGHLLAHGVDPEVVGDLMLAWNRTRCRPPLDDDEVAGVVASITRLHEREDEG